MAEKTAERLIEGMPWLDPLADSLQQAVHEAVQSQGEQGQIVKDALHGRWLGHPLHPALVAVPLGAWTATLVLDFSGVEQGADISLGVGIAGATGAALAGLADWSDTYGIERRTGLLHALLNTGGLAMNVASLVLRRTGARKQGIILSTLAFALGNLSAFLGGELAYTRGVGVNHVAWDQPPDTFTPVIALDELQEGKPVRGEVDCFPVVLVKQGEAIFALDATCPHAGGPLNEGTVEGDAIVCPWHGSKFRLSDGSALRGPTTEPAIALATRVRNGMVEVQRTTS